MNEFKDSHPPQADLNVKLDNTQQEINNTYVDAQILLQWTREATTDEEKKAAIDLLTEVGHNRSHLLAKREQLFEQMDRLLEEIGEEQAIDLAGAILRMEGALQNTVDAQQQASDALVEVEEISFSNPVSPEEIVLANPVVEAVANELGPLNKITEMAMQKRAARLLRKLDEDEVTRQLIREGSKVERPRAWEDISWHAAQ